MGDIADDLRRVIKKNAPEGLWGDQIAMLERALAEIECLRSLAGPVSATPTASEIYQGLRHPSPVVDAEGA